jgi:hypothetical protein
MSIRRHPRPQSLAIIAWSLREPSRTPGKTLKSRRQSAETIGRVTDSVNGKCRRIALKTWNS